MENGMSLSDIAAVTRGTNEENGWGSGWFLIVVLFLFMFGFGGNGWNRKGEFGQFATAASQQEILFGQQFGQLNDRLTNIGNGICNLGYEMQGGIGQLGKEMALAQNGTNMAMANGFAQAELSRSNQQAALMQQLNAMQMQAANCCCENRAAIAQVRYDMAAQACDTRNTVQNATRDIIDANNQNSRAILDFLTQSKLSDLQAENQGLKLAASQAAQNSYLVSQLRPSPIPAYTVQNPYCCNQFAGCGC